MAEDHQSVDWGSYFKSIRNECPWSYRAWLDHKIEICEYTGQILPLGDLEARVYVINSPESVIESLTAALNYDNVKDEWLYSYPGYGPFATPCSVLIQQNKQKLNELRISLGETGA